MPLVIREFHAAASPSALNEEWILFENTGPTEINTASCTLSLSNKDKRGGKPRILGSLDPGFLIRPGEKVRMVTGSPAKKAQGTPPTEGEGVRNYHLFLREPVLAHKGTLHVFLRQHELCSAEYPFATDSAAAALSP